MHNKNKKPQEVANRDDAQTLSRAISKWFGRMDNSFYDVDDLFHKRSRVDIEQTALIRLDEEFPEIELTQPLVAAVFKRTIQSRDTDTREMILPWPGR